MALLLAFFTYAVPITEVATDPKDVMNCRTGS